MRHSSSNFFIGRYAFIALPIGNSLDINFLHNQAKQSALGVANPWANGYLRNQGVGSWEINLAGFLHTVNTNWDFYGAQSYSYATNNGRRRGSRWWHRCLMMPPQFCNFVTTTPFKI